jgi:hypothetical protein
MPLCNFGMFSSQNPKKMRFLIPEIRLVLYDAPMKLFISAAIVCVGMAVSALSPPALASHHNPRHAHRVHRKKDGHSQVTHHPYHTHKRHTSSSRPASKATVVRTHRAVAHRKLSATPQPCPVALTLPLKSQPALAAWAGTAPPSVAVLSGNQLPASASSADVSFVRPATEPASRPQYRQASPELASERPTSPGPLRTLSRPSDFPEETESAPLRMRPVFPSAQSRTAPEKDTRVAVTLIYKDGRAEQIRNYLLSPTLLCILDGNRDTRFRDIPVEQLDLEATVKANQEAGIEFALPKTAE